MRLSRVGVIQVAGGARDLHQDGGEQECRREGERGYDQERNRPVQTPAGTKGWGFGTGSGCLPFDSSASSEVLHVNVERAQARPRWPRAAASAGSRISFTI